jgi:hypothetical protein
MRRAFLWIYLVAVTLVVIGVLLQAFSITAYIRGAGSGALDMHETVGFITHDLEILAFLAALVGFWGSWGRVGLALLLPVIGTIQVFVIGDTDTSGGWANGLHGLLALVVLILAGILTHDALRGLGLRAPRGA